MENFQIKCIKIIFVIFLAATQAFARDSTVVASDLIKVVLPEGLNNSYAEGFKSRATPAQMKIYNGNLSEVNQIIDTNFNKPVMKNMAIYISSNMELDEINQVLKFYTSPTGKKFLEMAQSKVRRKITEEMNASEQEDLKFLNSSAHIKWDKTFADASS